MVHHFLNRANHSIIRDKTGMRVSPFWKISSLSKVLLLLGFDATQILYIGNFNNLLDTEVSLVSGPK